MKLSGVNGNVIMSGCGDDHSDDEGTEAGSGIGEENAFSAMTKGRAGAMIGLTGGVITSHRRPIAELAAKHRLPAMHPVTEFVDDGGLIAYGPNYAD